VPYRDPEKRRASVREAVRRHAAGAAKPRTKPLPELRELRLATAQDALAVLQEQLGAVRRSRADVLAKARTCGYLVSVALRCVEAGAIEERLSELEAALDALGHAECAS